MKTTSQPQGQKKQAALEQDWVRDIREGKLWAFEQLFRTYCGQLVNFARRYVTDLPVAENIVQDVFLSVWTRREQLDPDRNINAYLYTATRNRALKELRHTRIETQSAGDLAHSGTRPKTPEDEWDERQVALQVNRAIARLPKRCRVIFSMSRFDQLTYAEIAENLNLSIKTVETQMGRALKALRRSLAHLNSILP